MNLLPEMRINVPKMNEEKLRQVLLYVLGKIGFRSNVDETILYKLLYFIDFDYYEIFEEQLTGSTYIKDINGPKPIEFAKIAKKMEEKGKAKKVINNYLGRTQIKYLVLKELDRTNLTDREQQHIDEVIARLGNMDSLEIRSYSLKDVPCQTTSVGKPIDYEGVFYRMPPYTVRSYFGSDL